MVYPLKKWIPSDMSGISECGWSNTVYLKRATSLLQLDVHGSVHHNTNLIEMTNKMQLCRTIYYSIVP